MPLSHTEAPPSLTDLDGLGPLERRVMETVWSASEALTVRDVRDRFEGELAYTTLMTTMDRLHKKGLLDRVRDGRAFAYVPRLSRGQAYGERATNLIRGLLQIEPQPVLSSIVDAVTGRDAELLDELHRLVQQKRREAGRR